MNHTSQNFEISINNLSFENNPFDMNLLRKKDFQ